MHSVKVPLSHLQLSDLIELAEQEGLVSDVVKGTAQVSFHFSDLHGRRHCLTLQRAARLLRASLRAHYSAISAPPPLWLDIHDGGLVSP
jgi:hypothetical protein